jgi:hypothetical protein
LSRLKRRAQSMLYTLIQGRSVWLVVEQLQAEKASEESMGVYDKAGGANFCYQRRGVMSINARAKLTEEGYA